MSERGGWMNGLKKKYYRVEEVAFMFSLSKSYIYDLVQRGRLQAWHPEGSVGSRGLRITAESVTIFEQQGKIDSDDYAR